MTPQETIKILKPLFEHCKGKNECLGYIEHFFTKDEEEALDMAIKALEQQPSEDYISRQVVKEMLTEEWTNSIPMGSRIYIEGYGEYVVEDRGGMAASVIDVYMGDYNTCIQFGRRKAKVYLVE